MCSELRASIHHDASDMICMDMIFEAFRTHGLPEAFRFPEACGIYGPPEAFRIHGRPEGSPSPGLWHPWSCRGFSDPWSSRGLNLFSWDVHRLCPLCTLVDCWTCSLTWQSSDENPSSAQHSIGVSKKKNKCVCVCTTSSKNM